MTYRCPVKSRQGTESMDSQNIKDDPKSEEQQGKNLADAALANNVQCFIWSTMPSSREISKGSDCDKTLRRYFPIRPRIKNIIDRIRETQRRFVHQANTIAWMLFPNGELFRKSRSPKTYTIFSGQAVIGVSPSNRQRGFRVYVVMSPNFIGVTLIQPQWQCSGLSWILRPLPKACSTSGIPGRRTFVIRS